eukprot:NODE_3873_length_1151_cov_48.459144_g3686_i0.p1 GENE.NODE_3873_length_1151_cov_48.459144_g3686_i0~~NODE_3873_length_1151_cov_48.459144_g3686_i0.p1  ORF type:complete len:340 (+),score=49.49 NODE_3873_length_1151_cov_48.459144_g3686_i0:99-1118(+)
MSSDVGEAPPTLGRRSSVTADVKGLIGDVERFDTELSSISATVRSACQRHDDTLDEIMQLLREAKECRKNVDVAKQEYEVAQKQKKNAELDIMLALRLQSSRLIYEPESKSETTPPLTPSQQQAVQGLTEQNFAIVDGFLSEAEAAASRAEVVEMHQGDHLRPGCTGGGRAGVGDKIISDRRSDLIRWLADDLSDYSAISRHVAHVNDFLKPICKAIPELRSEYVERGDVMVACYPGNGTRYTRHVDNPDENGRIITTILYLNPNWKTEDGGVLEICPADGPTTKIEPLFNRLIVFWSDRRVPHQVLPTSNTRYTVTVWYQLSREKLSAQLTEGQECGD